MKRIQGTLIASRRRLAPEHRRQELVEAAETVIRERGLDAKIDDVVRYAGAARATFYVYFDSWDALLWCLQDRIFERFEASWPLPDLRASDLDWRGLLDGLAEHFVRFTLDLKGLHAALFHSAMAPPPSPDPRFDIHGRIARLLEAGNASGALRVGDPPASARLVFAALHETVDAIEEGADAERSLAACKDMLWRALGATRERRNA